MSSRARLRALTGCGLVALLAAVGCESPPADVEALSIRLVDQLEPEWIDGTPIAASGAASDAGANAGAEAVPRTEWRFDTPPPASPPAGPPGTPPDPHAATFGFAPFTGIDDLRIADGRLVGTVTEAIPVLAKTGAVAASEDDVLYEIQIRMKVSEGSRLAVEMIGSSLPSLELLRGGFGELPWAVSTPIEPGEEMRTYSLRPAKTLPADSLHFLLIQPTDVVGARFEIESIRLIFRQEYLAGIPSGIGWQGLDEHYRETVVVRVPEVVRWPVEVPERGRLEVAIGTVEDAPMHFRVSVEAADGGDEPVTVIDRTITTPHRWSSQAARLDAWAGQNVVLRLAVESSGPGDSSAGRLAFWGSPVVRRRLPDQLTSTRPRGVIVVLADTLRSDHLDLYGYHRPTTPELSALAADGAVFEHAVAQASWTKVSAPSIFTGLYPSTHGVAGATDRLPASAVTLAEVFREAGWATTGLASVIFAGTASNMHQGYEGLVEHEDFVDAKTARPHVDRLIEWLESHHDVPFYALLHVFDPHSPYEPRPPWSGQFADPAWHDEHRRDGMTLRRETDDIFTRVSGMATADELTRIGIDPARYIERETAWYDGSIAGMDAEIGRLVDVLRQLGVLDDILWVVVSDHGEELHDHGRMFHGQSVYGELTRVPLIVRWPSRVAPSRVADVVQTIDVVPTVLDLVGLDVPDAVQGRSLVPLVDVERPVAERALRPLPAVSEQQPVSTPGAPPPRDVGATALTHDGFKLIHHHTGRADDRPEFELFDAASDPLDQHDIAAEHPEVVERLRALLDEWRRAAEAARLPDDATAMDPEALERLRALGYVQ